MNKKLTLGLPLLFSLTLFVSAALMFTVQPMAGKMLTPLFGGAPSTWLAAMVYFQTSLLIGYGLAFGLSRFSLRTHIGTLCGLLLTGSFFLPLQITGSEDNISASLISNDFAASWDVVLLLTASLSLPFIALSSLSPSLQRLFAGSKRDPYFLFAASNLGSFGGLFAYPFLFEKYIGLHEQAMFWQWGYALLFTLCVICLFVAHKIGIPIKEVPATPEAHSTIKWGQKFKWVVLAFVPSSLMMGVTAHVTADTGAVPLFWILPLGLYLLTFVIAFAKTEKPKNFTGLFTVQAFSIVLFTLLPLVLGEYATAQISIGVALLVFYVSALLYHKLLSASRPDASYLTQFYLWVSFGGALGGMFNVFVAPIIFTTAIEFLFLALFSLYIPILMREDERIMPDRWGMIGLVTTISFAIALHLIPDIGAHEILFRNILRLGLILSLVLIALRPWLSATSVLVILIIFAATYNNSTSTLTTTRNFFGVLRISEEAVKDKDITIRKMIHGTTLHGIQQVKPTVDLAPTSYYKPVGDVLAANNAKNVGMIGLGAGTVVCHTAPNRTFTVYEIDQAVIDLAQEYFTFMRDCGQPDIQVGDGRKLLERDKDKKFDSIIVDAFSSDSIPVHLLTHEAMQLYLDRLAEQGLIAFHVSNQFYDLLPQLKALADASGTQLVIKRTRIKRSASALQTSSVWAVMARENTPLAALQQQGWTALALKPAKLWTDDYSDMLSALSFNLSKKTKDNDM